MAKHRKRRTRRNPPRGMVKRVLGGIDLLDIGIGSGAALAVKSIPKMLPAAVVAKVPPAVLEGLTVGGLVVGSLFLPPKWQKAALTGLGIGLAIQSISNLTGGRLGLENELDLEGAGLGLASLAAPDDGLNQPFEFLANGSPFAPAYE